MEDVVLQRVLPHSEEAEQSVIGSMIMDVDAIGIANEILRAEDFYNKTYKILFATMVELNNEGKAVDTITLSDRLKEKNVPPEVSSLDYVGELLINVPTSANIREYATIVHEKAILRNVIKVTDDIGKQCFKGEDSADKILENTEKQVFDLVSKRSTSKDCPSIREVVLDAVKRIEAAAKAGGTITGIASGFTELDYKTAGFQKSDLILIAARPSMGKTAFVLNIAQNVAIKQNVCTAIFSLEMSQVQLVNRLLSLESNVNSQVIRTGKLTDADWRKLLESGSRIGKSKLIIDDTPGISIAELRSKCRKYKAEFGLGLVIIDYLQLMSGNGKSDSRQQEISEISRSLKAVAREIDAPVIALSQLSRAVEQRPDHRPMLSDLRESGAIEQDADVVMFIYRDDYYNHDSENKGVSEIIIAKQRNGPIGTVELAWLPDYTKFMNLERRNFNKAE